LSDPRCNRILLLVALVAAVPVLTNACCCRGGSSASALLNSILVAAGSVFNCSLTCSVRHSLQPCRFFFGNSCRPIASLTRSVLQSAQSRSPVDPIDVRILRCFSSSIGTKPVPSAHSRSLHIGFDQQPTLRIDLLQRRATRRQISSECWIKRSICWQTDQFTRNCGGVDASYLLQWILKWELQRHHCCRCTHLPTLTITPTRTGAKVSDEINKEDNDKNTNNNTDDDANDNADANEKC